MGCGSSGPVKAQTKIVQRSDDDAPVKVRSGGPMKVAPQQQQQSKQGGNNKSTQEVVIREQPAQNIGGGKLFEDPEFPAIVQSLTTDSSHENFKHFKDAVWKRPNEIMNCSYDEIKVFDTIDVNDIAQGILGDCYFLAALSGLAEEPNRVQQLIQTPTANKEGKYSVKFYLRGVPTVVTIDDRFPCRNQQPYDPLFSRPKGKELWAILLEKAWAKLFKSYTNVEAGTVDEALEHLTGAPSFKYKSNEGSDDEVWARLKQADMKKYGIGASSKNSVQKATGIVGSHAYTVIGAYEVEGRKLLKLRNPWGQFEWKGDFSDSSPLWTDSLKKAVGYQSADDGIFFMTLKDFRGFYDNYSIHHIQDNWNYSYVEQKSGPKHANYYKFSVDKPCEAYFRIHQKDERSLSDKEKRSYQLSPASFMIAKVEKDARYRLVLDSNAEVDHKSIQGGVSIYMTKDGKVQIKEAGEYIIRAKVPWKHGKEDTCTISAYSSAKIDLKAIPSVKDFQTKYLTLLAEQNKEEQPLISQSVMVTAPYEGYVYVLVKNKEKKQLTCSVMFSDLQNLKLSKPSKVSEDKFTMKIAPGASQLVFLKTVDRFQATSYEWSFDCNL